MKNKDLITIDTKAIILSKNEAGDIVLSMDAKNQLQKVLDFKKLADEIFSYVQDQLTKEMGDKEIKKIIAGNISISKRLFGSRFQLTDEDVDEKFTKEVLYIKPNSEEIDKYYEISGELPRGIELKDRTEKATIKERSS